ncbi:glycosyltransferase family 4 protein [Empedobacter falsenii]|uniref:glycosyltransferase family 4 protein n=1 Tax=Empedobacter falsenii TaxID=343874 RepID=UPI002575FC68|nr:glycosyltransferase family 1 protein [Empedobacter falsenii]MDM1547827.1 glycosyltransferase family 4 protein [Empedobacter falsenii]
MKIVLDNIIFWLQRSGGGSVYWTELVKRFNDNDEIDVSFYDEKEECNNIFRKELRLKNILIEDLLSLRIRRYLNFTKSIKAKSIFHSSYFRVSKSKNAINVTTIHDLTSEKFDRGLSRFVNFQQKKHAIKYSKGIICISENTKKDLFEFYPEAKQKNVKVIYNGISEDFFEINEDFEIHKVDNRFATLQDKKYILFVGRRNSYKNFPIVVKAAQQVMQDYKLVVIGEPFNEEEEQFVKSYLGSSYLLISKLENVKLNYLYNKAFALLYPSSYEGFGIPIAEAMKTHCPVIAANNSSIPEVAGNGAILYDDINEKHIVEGIYSLENNEFRKDLISKGFQQSTRFDWNTTFKEYLEFYKELYYEE